MIKKDDRDIEAISKALRLTFTRSWISVFPIACLFKYIINSDSFEANPIGQIIFGITVWLFFSFLIFLKKIKETKKKTNET